MVANKKMGELMDELNQDKDFEKMMMSDTKIGEVYRNRIKADNRPSVEIKFGPKNRESKFMEIKKDLFKINKKFLEDFKNYQIIKLNILRNEDEYDEATHSLKKERRKGILLSPIQKTQHNLQLSISRDLQNKNFEDLSVIEKKLIEEEMEQIKKMKIRRLERTLTKELQHVVRRSNRMFSINTPKIKPKKKKVKMDNKCSTVYSEDEESEWNSSMSSNDSTKVKIATRRDRELKNNDSKDDSSSSNQDTKQLMSPQIKRRIGESLLQHNICTTIYNENITKLKENLIKMIKLKIAKFSVNSNTEICKEKLKLSNDLLENILSDKSFESKLLQKLRRFQVEFADLIKLIERYIRSLNLSNIKSTVFKKLEIEKKITKAPNQL